MARSELSFRQIHLDFHTSPHIPGVGREFDRSAWQDALRTGHVDSITCFSKCHHGWSYHRHGCYIVGRQTVNLVVSKYKQG